MTQFKRRGVVLYSRCNCCTNYELKNIPHLFGKSIIAKWVWTYFSNTCCINFLPGPLKTIVMKWWLTKTTNDIKYFYSVFQFLSVGKFARRGVCQYLRI